MGMLLVRNRRLRKDTEEKPVEVKTEGEQETTPVRKGRKPKDK